ncbi:MAG: FKBP-type peptidyl-prolyl cis-trans isomerase [Opitutaceae bacterium]|nr:FKBP-type peptidyl-prolyl cis-trans isomerase [Opitutaceae bacterium]MBP9913401.1 FKBP-type peptidyl-prolyl cis-trans isomerase [Opitutaceae bacterium]
MKLKSLITTGLFGFGVLAVAQAQEVKFNVPGKTDAPAPAASNVVTAPAPAAPAQTFSEAEILETFGWFVAARIGVNSLEFSPTQIDSFTKGVALAAAGKEPPHDLNKVGPIMDEFIKKRQEVAMEKLKQQNLQESAAFFATLKAKPGVKTLPSGLAYEIVQPGTGPSPKESDTVTINYTGTLIDGHVFDSSVKRGQPETIALTEVIPGWTEGLQQINKGGKIKLYIPAALGYGDHGAGEIPPGAVLIFDVELIDFNPTPATAPATAAPAAK